MTEECFWNNDENANTAKFAVQEVALISGGQGASSVLLLRHPR